ncbi:Endolytic murein transglycosylase [Desulfovibrionales bacterium]
MRKFLLVGIVLLLSIIFSVASYVWHEADHFLRLPPEDPGKDVVVTIESGWTFEQIARALEAVGVVRNGRYLVLLGKWRNRGASLPAGEFKLSTGWVPDRVLNHLTTAKPILYRLSIHEGMTWWETAKVVEESGFSSFDEFKRFVHDREFLAQQGMPFDSAEGFLFPETYLFKRPTGRETRQVIELFFRTFREHAARIWPNGLPLADELRRVVTLASLVEKESAVAAERIRIAGVYRARISRGMLLQCDPTVIYGLGLLFDGNLKRRHLEDASNRYNTYVHLGWPPGPICSPGRAALQAAVCPESTQYLYFVATGNGNHHFSTTLSEHNRAVYKYQIKKK